MRARNVYRRWMPLPFVYGTYVAVPLTFFVFVGKIFSSGVV